MWLVAKFLFLALCFNFVEPFQYLDGPKTSGDGSGDQDDSHKQNNESNEQPRKDTFGV